MTYLKAINNNFIFSICASRVILLINLGHNGNGPRRPSGQRSPRYKSIHVLLAGWLLGLVRRAPASKLCHLIVGLQFPLSASKCNWHNRRWIRWSYGAREWCSKVSDIWLIMVTGINKGPYYISHYNIPHFFQFLWSWIYLICSEWFAKRWHYKHFSVKTDMPLYDTNASFSKELQGWRIVLTIFSKSVSDVGFIIAHGFNHSHITLNSYWILKWKQTNCFVAENVARPENGTSCLQ